MSFGPIGFLGGQVRLKQLGPKRVKAFGKVTLGPTLGAIGCKLLLAEDAEATAKIRARARTRHSEQVRYKPATRC